LYEARSGKDHSVVLNSAIRKYGEDDFDVKMLVKCDLDKLDDWEIEYIEMFNTLIPNGYNIMKGGGTRKMSDDGRERLRAANLGKKHSDARKLHISLGNMFRSQDPDLPKYVKQRYLRKNDSVLFEIRYPLINGTKLSYIEEYFPNLNSANERISALELEHKTTEKINQIKIDRVVSGKSKRDKTELPEYVTPIYKDTLKIGYRVSNYMNTDGTIVPSKDFTSSHMSKRNIHNAKVYIEELKRNDNNALFVIPPLPSGFFHFIEKNRVGTRIEGFKIRTGYKDNTNPNSPKKKIPTYKKFCDMKMTLKDKYNAAKAFYDTLE
jgi:hypothetical protein